MMKYRDFFQHLLESNSLFQNYVNSHKHSLKGLTLYHGTAPSNLLSIFKNGVKAYRPVELRETGTVSVSLNKEMLKVFGDNNGVEFVINDDIYFFIIPLWMEIVLQKDTPVEDVVVDKRLKDLPEFKDINPNDIQATIRRVIELCRSTGLNFTVKTGTQVKSKDTSWENPEDAFQFNYPMNFLSNNMPSGVVGCAFEETVKRILKNKIGKKSVEEDEIYFFKQGVPYLNNSLTRVCIKGKFYDKDHAEAAILKIKNPKLSDTEKSFITKMIVFNNTSYEQKLHSVRSLAGQAGVDYVEKLFRENPWMADMFKK